MRGPSRSDRSRRLTSISSPVIPAGTVTALIPSAQIPGRYDLIVNGDVSARVSIDAIERLDLRVGAPIDEALGAAIAHEAEVIRVYDRAIAMLASRGRATGELRRLLVRKGASPKATEEAIGRLTSVGFLHDLSFAKQFVRYRAIPAGLSRRRIERELSSKGVDRETIREAVDQTFRDEDVDESVSIHRAAEKKLRMLARVDDQTKRRRLYGFLARRGYDSDAINAVMRTLHA